MNSNFDGGVLNNNFDGGVVNNNFDGGIVNNNLKSLWLQISSLLIVYNYVCTTYVCIQTNNYLGIIP